MPRKYRNQYVNRDPAKFPGDLQAAFDWIWLLKRIIAGLAFVVTAEFAVIGWLVEWLTKR